MELKDFYKNDFSKIKITSFIRTGAIYDFSEFPSWISVRK